MNNFYEHLYPQMSRDQLDKERTLNYQRTQAFYKIRMDGFKDSIYANLQEGENNIINHLNKTIQEKWNVVFGQFWGMINYMRKNSNSINVLSYAQNFYNEIYNNQDSTFEQKILADTLLQFAKNPKQNAGAVLGNSYEVYITAVLQAYIAQMADISNDKIEELIQSIVKTGSKTSKGYTVAKDTSIRADIILGAENENYTKKNGVLSANGVEIELQNLIDLTGTQDVNDVLEEMALKYNNAGLYGLSLKVWKDGNSKEFTQSKPLRDNLQSVFSQKDSHGRRRAWDEDYVTVYMLWKISSWLINILSPTTIGIVTSAGFEGYDTWLSNHLFYMDIQLTKIRKDPHKGMPETMSSAIKIRNFNHNAMKVNNYLRKKNKSTARLMIQAIPKKV